LDEWDVGTSGEDMVDGAGDESGEAKGRLLGDVLLALPSSAGTGVSWSRLFEDIAVCISDAAS
jgi:hypothetical protein